MKAFKQLWPLLRQHISPGQLAGYALANIVGLAIVVSAVQFARDSSTPLSAGTPDPFSSADFAVLSKKVEGVGFTPAAFTPDEIADLKSRPWARRVGEFTAARFNVVASVGFGGRGFSSMLFFESIPDEFIDALPEGWDCDPAAGDRLPVIVSRDYLALYNFGFALPQGLPQVSEDVVSAVPVTFTLSGDGSVSPIVLTGRIAGFSSRLNTIAVPESFMRRANKLLSPAGDEASGQQPSRLIVEVAAADVDRLADYADRHGLERSSADGAASRLSHLATLASAVVSAVGVVICLLAFFILLLSVYLLLQKNRTTLRNLMLLGYSPDRVAACYQLTVGVLNAAVAVVAVAAALAIRQLWLPSLGEIDLGGASAGWSVATGLGAFVAVTVASFATIRTKIGAIWPR